MYHCAASIRFDEHLTDAILSSVRSSREIVNLALEMKQLKAYIHVSTGYCNADKRTVEEKLYPVHGNWRDAIYLAENEISDAGYFLSEKYIHPLPNTYAYAKSLAEHVVNDLCSGKIPAAIVRPTMGKLNLI